MRANPSEYYKEVLGVTAGSQKPALQQDSDDQECWDDGGSQQNIMNFMEDTQFNQDPETMYNEQSSIQQTTEEMSGLPGRGSVLGLKGGYGGMSKKQMNNFENLCQRLVHKKIKERVIRKKPIVSMYGNIMLKPEIKDQDNKSFLE